MALQGVQICYCCGHFFKTVADITPAGLPMLGICVHYSLILFLFFSFIVLWLYFHEFWENNVLYTTNNVHIDFTKFMVINETLTIILKNLTIYSIILMNFKNTVCNQNNDQCLLLFFFSHKRMQLVDHIHPFNAQRFVYRFVPSGCQKLFNRWANYTTKPSKIK